MKITSEKIPLKQGRVLVLCMGGGREAIALAQRGFEVVGVDFVPEVLEKARENAAPGRCHHRVAAGDLRIGCPPKRL